MSESTSVGKVQLDIEISKSSLAREIGGLNKAFRDSFRGSFNGIGNQMNGFMKNTMSKIASDFKNFAQVGNKSNQEVAQSATNMNSKYEKTQLKISAIRKELERLLHQQDMIARNYANMPALSGMSRDQSMEQLLSGDSNYQELAQEIESLEEQLQRLTIASEVTRNTMDGLENGISRTSTTTNNARNRIDQATNSTRRLGRGLRDAGNNATESTNKIAGFTNMITKSFMRVLKRIFILNLIYKAVRGLINYIGSALKTNKQFANSVQTIGTNLRVAFQPIYDFVLPAINALMRGLATATTYIASAMSGLFGKTYKQSYDAAKGIERAKKEMDRYGKSAKKAGQLAGFDEINQLDIKDDEDSGGSDGFEMSMPEIPTTDFSGFEKFKDMLQPTIDSLKNLGLALDPLKNFVSTGLQDFYDNFLLPVGTWVMGEGLPRFIDAITKGLMAINWGVINESLNNLWKALAPFAINVGEGLLWFWENVLFPLGTWTMNHIVPVFLDMIAGAIRILNEVIEIFKPFGLWLWENFLQPLAKWTGGIIVSVLEKVADALKGIGDLISNHKTLVENMAIIVGSFALSWGLVNFALNAWNIGIAIWNGIGAIATGLIYGFGAAMAFITSPIGLVTIAIGAVIAIGVLLYQHWDEISIWIKELWEGIKIKAEEIWNGIKDFFVETWNSTKENAIEIWDSVKTFFIETWDNIKTKTEEIWNGIKTFLIEKIWNPIKNTASTIFNSIKSIISTIFNTIKTTTSTIWNGITGGLKTSFDTIYNNSVTIFNKMKSFIKGITDSIEGFFKGMVNGVIKALNTMINGLNKLNVNIPDWVPGIGGESLGFNIPKIPMLARGGIIDQPTLAMVGERGKEAVVPLENTAFVDTLASALGNAVMAAMQLGNISQNSGDNGDIILQLDGTTIARILGPIIDKEKGRIGSTIIQPI